MGDEDTEINITFDKDDVMDQDFPLPTKEQPEDSLRLYLEDSTLDEDGEDEEGDDEVEVDTETESESEAMHEEDAVLEDYNYRLAPENVNFGLALVQFTNLTKKTCWFNSSLIVFLWLLRHIVVGDDMEVDDEDLGSLPEVQDGFVAGFQRWCKLRQPIIVNSVAVLQSFLRQYLPTHLSTTCSTIG